jgi:hypothetical protein
LKYRHLGGAAGAFGEWLFSFITVFAGGIALGNVGWKIWLWMLLSCAAAVPFVYFMCPEVSVSLSQCFKANTRQTTGKTLEEIDLLFVRSSMKDSAWAQQTVHEDSEKSGTVFNEKV